MNYTKQVLICKTFNNRTFPLLFFQFFIIYIYLKPLKNFSHIVQHKLTPWLFPFMISDVYFLILFMLSIVYFFSDVPFMQHYNMYQLIRTGRKKWAIGQICTIIIQSFCIMAINNVMVFIVLGKDMYFELEWGKILHTISMTNVAQGYDILFNVSNITLSNHEPLNLMIISLVMGGLVVSLIGLIMFCVSLIWKRSVAVVVNLVMITLIFFIENVHVAITEKFGKFIPVNWIRVANIEVKKYGYFIMPSLEFMFIALLFLIIVICMLILLQIKKVEFSWNTED